MKLTGLNGKTVNMPTMPSKFPVRSEASCRSKLQYLTGCKLQEKYPFDPLLEDVSVPGHKFYLDFFLPRRKIAVEIDGIQHKEYVHFFHKNQKGFRDSQDRDLRKEEFCRINDIRLIRIETEKDLENL